MRRIVPIVCALAALSGGVAHAGDSPIGAAGLTARLVSCDLTGPDRSAAFYGRMESIPGAARMSMRFTLLERLGHDGDFAKTDVPALRQWHRSAPGVKAFGWKQTVDNLRSGGAYKARITYRWTSAAGIVLDTETRDSPVCRGPQPNLTVGGVDVRPGPTADTRVYRVTVQNTGKAAADDVPVVLSIDHAVLDSLRIDRVDAGSARTVSFTGPPCNRALRVLIDAGNTIGEVVETDNSALLGCPD
jgi:hypothetical protein